MAIPPPPLPTLIKLAAVVGYVKTRHGLTVSRQTPYNWATIGLRGVKLKTQTKAGRAYTTHDWVDRFLIEAGQ
jgi:hypothetical protein